MNSRAYWMTLLSMSLVVFFMLVFPMYKSNFFAMEGWMSVFLISGIISIGLMTAGSFPYLRKKETITQFYMQPASILEKFAFEFLLRFVGFWVIFPLLFWGVGELAYFISSGLRAMRGLGMEEIQRVSFLFESLRSDAEILKVTKYFVSGILLAMSFIFTGTCRFMKHALLKTVLFVAGLGGSIIYYFYFLTEKLGLKAVFIKEPENNTWLVLVVAVFGVLVLAYGYFKVKEKEV